MSLLTYGYLESYMPKTWCLEQTKETEAHRLFSLPCASLAYSCIFKLTHVTSWFDCWVIQIILSAYDPEACKWMFILLASYLRLYCLSFSHNMSYTYDSSINIVVHVYTFACNSNLEVLGIFFDFSFHILLTWKKTLGY